MKTKQIREKIFRQAETGITLVALIITIIILVILVAVSITVVYRTKIVNYAINGTYNYIGEGIKENRILEETESKIESAVDRINNIIEGRETGGNKAEVNNSESKVKVTCNIEEGIATIYNEETDEWQIEWQKNDDKEEGWTREKIGAKEIKITGLTYSDFINVRLTKGGSIKMNKTFYMDQEKPQLATMKLNKVSPTSTIIGPIVKAKVTQVDNESGIDISKCKWTYSKADIKIGTEEEKYTGEFNSSEEKIETDIKEEGRYYLHVLSVDKAGNKTETISEPIDVRQTVNLYNFGEQYEEITGKWIVDVEGTNSSIGQGGFKLTTNNDNMNMKAGSGWNAGIVSPCNYLDYTSFHKYCYNIDNQCINDYSYCWNCLAVYKSGLSYWDTSWNILKPHDEAGNNLTYKIEIDDVEVPEQNKIGFIVGNLSTEITLYKVWLE